MKKNLTTLFTAILYFLHKTKIVEGFLGKTKPSTAMYSNVHEEHRQVLTTKSPTIVNSDEFDARREDTKPTENRQVTSNDACKFISINYRSTYAKRLLSYLKTSPILSQWLWFIILWSGGLGSVLLLTYPIKLLIKFSQ